MNNHEAIERALLNYVEGWFEGNAVRMEEALHAKLAKRHYDNGTVNELDCDTMIDYTKNQYGKDEKFDSSKVEIKILDVYKNIATAIIITKYVDYVHLVKKDGKWKILNVLWDHFE